MPRVLIISYYGPPLGGTQAFRLHQFTKHLPANGWRCTVITANESAYQDTWKTFHDNASFSLAGVHVIRSPAPSVEGTAARIYTALRPTHNGDGAPRRRPPGAPSTIDRIYDVSRNRALGLAAAAASVLASPDRLVAWAPGAILRGLSAAVKADLIYACGPPYTNHIVAAALAGVTGKPLVVMVDDPWVSMAHRHWRSPVQKTVQTWQEQVVLTRARAILTGTHGFRDDIVQRLGKSLERKTHVIYWGFDPDDYHVVAPSASSTPEAPFELLYTGSLRGEQYDATVLFSVLSDWLASTPDLADRLRLRLLGAVDDRSRQLVADLGIGSLISFEGFAPHRQLAARATTADALLLIINDTRPMFRNYTSGKLFHYIGLRKPILALVPPDGEAAKIIREKGLGLIASPNDPSAVRRTLERFVANGRPVLDSSAACDEYTSSRLIAHVAHVFDDIVARR